ncbi:MAG: NAD(P)/FAD-dependent oxidoreductase [Solirubrobacteraceae bacterium]|nr:NAD(P)/FAD-dependent oxidoreductase [Solirubrobacteraceae bacterium]
MAWNVVIAGGGFGGVHTAKYLARVLPRHSARITLVNDTNFMLYTPLLPGAAAGTLEPRHVVVPLRETLPDCVDLLVGKVTGASPEDKGVFVDTISGESKRLRYDQLVVALGSVSRTLPIPGLAEYGLGLKSLPEAIALRNRVLRNLELAESTEDPVERRAALTFVFVGAGYAGLEGLAELQDFASEVLDLYPRARVHGMRWILVEARDRVMPEVSPSLANFAARELTARGIELRTSTTLEEITDNTARLSDGEVVPTRTVVWTAGVKPHPVVANLGLPLNETGRVIVDNTLAVQDRPGVWAIGDNASVPDPASKGQRPAPPTAQHAIRQGRTAGRNVAAALGTGSPTTFKYKTRGVVVDMGQRKAVAETMGIRWRGTPAWFITRTYHLAMIPGLGRRGRLLADWNVGLLFGRDTAELGQLGNVPRLGEGDLSKPVTAGNTPADTESTTDG